MRLRFWMPWSLEWIMSCGHRTCVIWVRRALRAPLLGRNHPILKISDLKNSPYGYGSIPINTIFSGMNIHLPAILMFTRGTRFWHTAISSYILFVQRLEMKTKRWSPIVASHWGNLSKNHKRLDLNCIQFVYVDLLEVLDHFGMAQRPQSGQNGTRRPWRGSPWKASLCRRAAKPSLRWISGEIPEGRIY